MMKSFVIINLSHNYDLTASVEADFDRSGFTMSLND